MDKQLNSKHNIKQLQNDVMLLRQEVPKHYKKYLEKEGELLVKKLVNAEFTIPVKNNKINDIDTTFLKEIKKDIIFPVQEFSNSANNIIKSIDNL